MTLRARLTLVLVAVVAAGLVVAGAATYAALRAFLTQRVDAQLVGAVPAVARELAVGFPRRGGQGVPSLPLGTYVEVRTRDGEVRATAAYGYGPDVPRPALPEDLGADGGGDGRLFDVEAEGPSDLRFRALAAELPGGGTLVVAVPLDEVARTLRRLLVVEAVVAATVLGAVGGLAWWLVRLGLRPLDEMTATATAIAGGDLSRRVRGTDAGTEVGRLGLALNTMLGRIEAALAERRASEERLRRFVADASHELRTPLTSIRGWAELFRRGADRRPEDLATAMRRIEDEATRMGVLVDDLLLLARLDQGRPLERARVDLARVAEDAVADIRVVDPDRPVALEADGPVAVEGDDARLRQVAGNLLANARAHTPPGTPVRVRVGAHDGEARLEVADEGPGMPEEAVARAFERFYRADPARSGGGSGLGLAIVAAVAEAHGGRVDLTSTPGEGTVVTVRLPAAGTAPG